MYLRQIQILKFLINLVKFISAAITENSIRADGNFHSVFLRVNSYGTIRRKPNFLILI